MSTSQVGLTLIAYRGDGKTLLAYSLPKEHAVRLAGFTILCQPNGVRAYYLYNKLQFEHPERHAQIAEEPAYSSVNAPIHKFRWIHVPGSFHGSPTPVWGPYTYTVVPRYFDEQGCLIAIDLALGVSIVVEVAPFVKDRLKLGFTRGYIQSEAFVHNFSPQAQIEPKQRQLLFDTAQVAGTTPKGHPFTYAEAYDWMGYTARHRIFEFLDEVIADPKQFLDVFAYDLNEPDICQRLLRLAKEGRVRVILDNAALHHSVKNPKMEDDFEQAFKACMAAPAASIMRGRFGSFAHDKIFVSFNEHSALKVLTGSTNFSINGLYVNSNHVLVLDDVDVAQMYGNIFEATWSGGVKLGAYLATEFATLRYDAPQAGLPETYISFAPHPPEFAQEILQDVVARIEQEETRADGHGSILFAVMDLGAGASPVYDALKEVHNNTQVISYGISDSTDNLALYEPGKRAGVLVTGKPGSTLLPPPFDQIPDKVGIGHQIHHKFVVCGFNTAEAVVYCGSSNFVTSGEQNNGDNLLTIRDTETATVFAIEALGLVDHFQFMDRMPKKTKSKQPLEKLPANKQKAAADAGWFLSTDDDWAQPYFVPDDFRARDRILFSGAAM
ncbi:MAG: phospholipase D-like domain-containing protein [Burkholderiaceae bacterium]